MTTDLFLAYVEAMPRLRAQKLLDAATAAIARFQQPSWWDWLTRAADNDDEEQAAQVRRSSPLSINGMPMPVGHAKLMLAGALGGGFADARAA